MKILREVERAEIENHLTEMGSGNHSDNMKQVKKYCTFHFAELTEEEYANLVFPEMSTTTKKIIEKAQSRKLYKVAEKTDNIDEKKLGPNWDLDEIAEKTKKYFDEGGVTLPPLLIRPSRDGEKTHGDWYIQDGAHRALGYAMWLKREGKSYTPMKVYKMS